MAWSSVRPLPGATELLMEGYLDDVRDAVAMRYHDGFLRTGQVWRFKMEGRDLLAIRRFHSKSRGTRFVSRLGPAPILMVQWLASACPAQ